MEYDLIVVSSYPRAGTLRDKFTVGVADYTKQTLVSLPSSLKILVLAEKLQNQPDLYSENNITVNRVWNRNSIFSFIKIFQQINKYSHTPVLFEFEMAMFGGPLMNIFFVKLLWLLKLFSHPSYVVLHQVVTNFNEISGHIGQSTNSPVNSILNVLAKIFYKSVTAFSTKVIVFEQFLKDRLSKNNSKIVVIPHGVEHQTVTKLLKKNMHFTITVFGYLAWYKGTDWVIDTFAKYFDRHPKSKFKLVIAGGPNPNHLDKPYYQKYLANIQSVASKYPQQIVLTGYIPESQISQYYQQSDVILLPYRVGMSSSGPLSLAFSYHKPFLVSSPIAPIFDTKDIKTNLPKHLAEFHLDSKSLFKHLFELQKNPSKLAKLSTASQNISQARSWQTISHQYLQCLNL